jgi:glucokinase
VAVGLDVGGTKLLGGLISESGEILHRREVPTPRTSAGCDPGLVALSQLARELRDDADAAGHEVRAIGLGFAEYVDDDRLTSSEVFAWDRQPADLMAEIWPGLPVAVGADVRCAAMAEARARSLPDTATMLYVSWGTGLSSSLVLGTTCLAGSRGEALALGEWSVSSSVDPGWTGNLESYASGHALGDRYEASTTVVVTGLEVAARSQRGDEIAGGIISTAASALTYALRDCVLLLDPDLIVLGGGVGTSGGELPVKVREALPGLLRRPRPPQVVPAQAGAEAGLIGAGLGAWDAVTRASIHRARAARIP